MPASSPARLLEAFRLDRNHYVYLIGAGGKTSLMFALARALAGEGHAVLTTTSTRIRVPGPGESGSVVAAPLSPGLAARLRGELGEHRHVTAAPGLDSDGQKLRGFTPAQLDTLFDGRVAEYLLVEADGAAGRSLKAHREHEPVVSDRADLVIVVVGADCLGAPLDDEHVHRAALLGERLGLAPGSPVRVEDVAALCFHPEGYLARAGAARELIVFLNKVATAEQTEQGGRLAEALQSRDAAGRINAIVIGDVKSGVVL
ncbi:MAG TPA: selenium cofactor biosynthesis protein YqeC [Candidatus Saccharimonadales bacterium]|nr:selenium cofactor biosynthesis protein YqeC [Candidatus Saccharimonadales bacterium]